MKTTTPQTAPRRPSCAACGGAMQPKITYRLGTTIAVIGYILLVPSILGLAASALTILVMLVSVGTGAPSTQDGDVALASFGVVGTIAVVAMIVGLPGFILTLRKKVLRCDSCGNTLNAS